MEIPMTFSLGGEDAERLHRLVEAVRPFVKAWVVEELDHPEVSDEMMMQVTAVVSEGVTGGAVFGVKIGKYRELVRVFQEVTDDGG